MKFRNLVFKIAHILQVKELCSEGTIAAYTPISTFYSNEINTAGFFIKCLEDKGLEVRLSTLHTLYKLVSKFLYNQM